MRRDNPVAELAFYRLDYRIMRLAGRSVGVVRLRTKGHGVFFLCEMYFENAPKIIILPKIT
jgi:hypothetical protein